MIVLRRASALGRSCKLHAPMCPFQIHAHMDQTQLEGCWRQTLPCAPFTAVQRLKIPQPRPAKWPQTQTSGSLHSSTNMPLEWWCTNWQCCAYGHGPKELGFCCQPIWQKDKSLTQHQRSRNRKVPAHNSDTKGASTTRKGWLPGRRQIQLLLSHPPRRCIASPGMPWRSPCSCQ